MIENRQPFFRTALRKAALILPLFFCLKDEKDFLVDLCAIALTPVTNRRAV